MRTALWPDDTGSHAADIARFFSPQRSEPLEVLLACSGAGAPLGFVELSIRPHAAGCTSDRVAFVEGWYVEPEHRRRGVGAALMRAIEEAGRAAGYPEIRIGVRASLPGNLRFYEDLGYRTLAAGPHPRGPDYDMTLGKDLRLPTR